jgi:hypothetical protein
MKPALAFRKSAVSLALLIAAGTLPAWLSAPAAAQTAEDLVAKNIEAHGGMANIKAITSLHQTGRLEVQGIVILLSVEQKPDYLFHMAASIQGMTQVQAYDGAQGWQINPFQGRRDPELMGEDDTRDLFEGADFYGPLVDYQQKGSNVEYVGHAEVDGDDALLLKVTLKNGDIINYFLDPDTYLEIRTERRMFVRGSVRESFINLGSYKKVNGVYFPFSQETGSMRNPGFSQKITFTKIEANVDIPATDFKMPGVPKAPAAPPLGGAPPTPSR